MPIVTNPNFDALNLALVKRPLYMAVIEGVFEPLTTFRLEDTQVTRSGYGLAGYGATGYGY